MTRLRQMMLDELERPKELTCTQWQILPATSRRPLIVDQIVKVH